MGRSGSSELSQLATPSKGSRALAGLSIRSKLTAVAGIGVLSLLVVAGVMTQAMSAVSASTDRALVLNQALQNEMQADMAHDGIRGAVTQALLFPTGPNHDDAVKSLADNIATINDELAAVGKAVDEPALNDALAKATPLVADYIKSAQATVDASKSGSSAADVEAAYATFLTSFNAVLDALPVVADELVALVKDEAVAVNSAQNRAKLMLWLTVLLGSVLIFVVAGFVASDLVRRVRALSDSVAAIGRGDLSREVPGLGTDEVGMMAAELEKSRLGIRQVVIGVADGVQTLQGASVSLSTASAQGASASRETGEQAQAVSGSTAHVTSAMEGLSAAAEEMTASIREIATSAAEAAAVAQNAVGVVKQTSSDVERLGRASAEIDEVVKVINGIADQTNLLALNATIEAARAGEAGKGFAVVAGEVKDLAAETAKATSDVSSRVAAIQAGAQAAVAAIEQISGIIEKINDYQTAVAAAVEEQTATTNEMSRGIAGIVASASEIAAGVQQVAAAAEVGTQGAIATETSAGQVISTAEGLRQVTGAFTV